jgi:type I restriction enzyme S subunit
MMEGWQEYKLRDLADSINRGITPKYVKANGYCVINQKCIRNNTLSYSEARLTSKAKKITEYKKVVIGDVLVNSTGTGTLGRTAFVKEIPNEITTVDTHVTIVRPNDLVVKRYLGYNLGFQEPQIENYAKGATNQQELGRDDLGLLKINLPPIPTQHKIANILSAYDDLIENNLKRISLLEEMAQNEFNNWYANNEAFEEVNLGSIIGHEIGGGWGAEEHSEEFNKPAYVIRGTDIDGLPNGKLEKVPFRFHKKSNLASRKLQDGDIIFEVSGGSSYEGVAKTLLVTDELLKQFDNAVMPASFCKLARPIERKYSSFLFLFWRFLRNFRGTEVFEIRSASNIVNYNWTAFLKFQKIKKPSETELEKFNKKIDPIFKQVYKLGNQNQYLKEARDILLPRLMTGMIDVENLEIEL